MGIHQSARKLVQRIFATIRNLGVNRLDALLVVGTLRDTELCLFLAIPAAGFELFAITGCRKVFQIGSKIGNWARNYGPLHSSRCQAVAKWSMTGTAVTGFAPVTASNENFEAAFLRLTGASSASPRR